MRKSWKTLAMIVATAGATFGAWASYVALGPETGFFEAFANVSPWAVVVAGALLAGMIVVASEWGQPSLEEQVTAPRKSGLRHAIVNLVGFAVVLAGAGVLLATNPPVVVASADKCTSDSGAECSGASCCADADACYTDASICRAIACVSYPSLCEDNGPGGSDAGGPN